MEDLSATSPKAARSKVQKRVRTAVACRRCKSRKQKCDGVSPTCANCANSEADCQYDVNPTLNRSQEQYIRARRRVEELEAILSRLDDVRAQNASSTSPSAAAAAVSTSPSLNTGRPDSAHDASRSSLPEEDSSSDMQHNRSHSTDTIDVLHQLSLRAAGGYVNPTSTLGLGRVLRAVASSKNAPEQATQGGLLEQELTPKSLENISQASSGNGNISLAGIPDVIADRMLEKGYFEYIATLWPVMQPKRLRHLHANRAKLQDRSEIAALHLVYAAAGRFLETTGETGSFRSEKHYQSALKLLDEILMLQVSINAIQVLLLLAIYSLRAPKGPGAWSYVGMAMRMCIESGLHRQRVGFEGEDSDHEDLRRRVFWSCYCLDRQVSMILGRPFAVADRDIDAALPFGTEQDAPGSMACFAHICRLRIIESHIQQSVYRVDEPHNEHSTSACLSGFIDQLETWKMTIPTNDQTTVSSSIENYDSYLIYYFQAVRFLLHPHITSGFTQDQYLQKAVEACGGICSTYKRLHQNVTVGFSLMALHSVFTAGVTMLYAAWKAPILVLTYATRNMINDCSIVLYIITERWPGAKSYRDLFERVKEPVLSTIDQHQGEPRALIDPLQPEVFTALGMMAPAQGPADFSSMLMEMAGDPDGTQFGSHQDDTGSAQNGSATHALSELDFMPGLAFDFSMPEPPNAFPPLQASLTASSSDWYSDHNAASVNWNAQQNFPQSW